MGLCREHIQAYTVFLTKVRTYKIALPPPNKEGRGPQRHLPTSPFFSGQFLRQADIKGFGVFIDIWSMGKPLTTEKAGGGERFSMTIFAGDHRDSHTRERFLLRIH